MLHSTTRTKETNYAEKIRSLTSFSSLLTSSFGRPEAPFFTVSSACKQNVSDHNYYLGFTGEYQWKVYKALYLLTSSSYALLDNFTGLGYNLAHCLEVGSLINYRGQRLKNKRSNNETRVGL